MNVIDEVSVLDIICFLVYKLLDRSFRLCIDSEFEFDHHFLNQAIKLLPPPPISEYQGTKIPHQQKPARNYTTCQLIPIHTTCQLYQSTTTTSTSTAAINTSSKINPEQAVAFAALILADDNLIITPEKLQALLKAAGIIEVEPIWTTLFANALKDKDVKDILTAVATSGPKAGGDTAPNQFFADAQDDGISGTNGIGINSGSDSEEDMCTFGFFD